MASAQKCTENTHTSAKNQRDVPKFEETSRVTRDRCGAKLENAYERDAVCEQQTSSVTQSQNTLIICEQQPKTA